LCSSYLPLGVPNGLYLHAITHVDPTNVPLASLVAQEEHVDVKFIRNNNFNNSAYRNNFGSNNYMPDPSNSVIMAIMVYLECLVKKGTICLVEEY
jgi:hypothetical protein